MHTRKEQMEAFGRFLDILDELREKCPWDRKQTNESLRPNTIEETYELCDALIRDDKNDICKELGDVLLHVAFYAKIGSETDDFDMKDVCDRLCEKLIFRHPHVFGDVKAETAGQVSENWEQLKLKEKDGNKTVLSGVPAALPSLIKAYRIQDKARNVGFDWEEREQVWDKVKEEIQEFQAEVAHMDKEKAEAEFGDVMFSLINAARLYKINPDNALERTNQKFINRFNYVEAHSIKEGKNLHDMTLEEMDKLWNEAKALEQERAKIEDLTEEELEMYDLLVKGKKLTKAEEQSVKLAAKNLYKKLTSERDELLVVDWYKDEQPKLKVKSAIETSLNNDLPESYDKEIFNSKINLLLNHFIDMAVQAYGWIANKVA